MQKLLINNVEEGMIIGEDVYNKYDVLIVSSGTIISENIYSKLINTNLTYINIIEKNIEGVSKVVIVKKDIQLAYNKTVKSFKKLFDTAKLGKQILSSQVRTILLPLMDQIENNSSMAKKLWQIESCDEYTYDHSVTVSLTAALLAKWLNMSDSEILKVATSGLLHDIGKCNIPDEILKKPDKLSDDEFKVMKTHTTLGYIMLKHGKEFDDDILAGIYQHHEKCDGKGYPNNLREDDIHIYGRIIAIADVYSAMTANRIYRTKMSPFLVAKLILENSFGYLDPEMTRIFLNNISNFYVGTLVKLNDGRIGTVVMINKNEPYRPLIQVDDDYIDLSKDYNLQIDALID